MEIDISIRNATPVELQRLILGMQMTDSILGKVSRNGMEVNFQQVTPPSPAITYKVAPGAEIPVTEPVKPIETAQAKLKKIAKPSKRDTAIKNAQAPRWTDPEKEIIEKHLNDPDSAATWAEYHERFPCQRNENAIYLKWYAYRYQGKKDKPASTPKESPRLEPKKAKKAAAAAASQSDCNKITMPSDGIVTGINVRQIKPVDGKLFFGTGTVLVRDGDLVTIHNGKGKKHTLDVRNLEIAELRGRKNEPISLDA